MLSLAMKSKACANEETERPVVIIGVAGDIRFWHGLGYGKSLGPERSAGGVQKCLGDPGPSMFPGNDKARDLTQPICVWIGFIGEGIHHRSWSGVAPADDLSLAIREVTLHPSTANPLASGAAILFRRPFRPADPGVVDVQELAETGSPPGVVDEGGTFEVPQEVRKQIG